MIRALSLAALAMAMLATPEMAASVSKEDCGNFIFLDIDTMLATEACNIDYMDNPDVVATVNLMNAAKCTDQLGKARVLAESKKAGASWKREVKELGLKGACSKMTAAGLPPCARVIESLALVAIGSRARRALQQIRRDNLVDSHSACSPFTIPANAAMAKGSASRSTLKSNAAQSGALLDRACARSPSLTHPRSTKFAAIGANPMSRIMSLSVGSYTPTTSPATFVALHAAKHNDSQ
jgi:hypothetical protein